MIGKICICCCVGFLIVAIATITCGIVGYKIIGSGKKGGPEYTVTNAVFNSFSMTPNKTLTYDLALTLEVDNKTPLNTDMKWETFKTIPVYESEELSTVDLAPIEMKKFGKKDLKPSYRGVKKMSKGDEKGKIYDIVLKINQERKGKFAFIQVDDKSKYECKLRVPVKSRGEKFGSTTCSRV